MWDIGRETREMCIRDRKSRAEESVETVRQKEILEAPYPPVFRLSLIHICGTWDVGCGT
ncbi:hypothetical protein DEO72_LG9g3305 [Vigna unguiculata]|uniref:Uncharacterized protein n=1 Tax=Vigna unguiculata TaxID=3917 RepID=A0A4D6N8K7_VIGUN|nr:hypothetical protein DEO72_LG9g3305 [Vigna unguiculata]